MHHSFWSFLSGAGTAKHHADTRIRLGRYQLYIAVSTYTRWKPRAVLGWSKPRLIAADWLWIFIQFGERRGN